MSVRRVYIKKIAGKKGIINFYGKAASMGERKVQKLPSVRRLPTYLHKLMEMRRSGEDIVATPELAKYMQCSEIAVRKDLAITGAAGQPGVGYRIKEVIDAILAYLHWDQPHEAVLAGAGSLGAALIGYEGFAEYGLDIIAAFDSDPAKIGGTVRGRQIFDVSRLPELCSRLQVELGIICVPAQYAQEVADLMVRGGVRAIWSFSNVQLTVPEGVAVQREVIAGGLAELSVKLRSGSGADEEKAF